MRSSQVGSFAAPEKQMSPCTFRTYHFIAACNFCQFGQNALSSAERFLHCRGFDCMALGIPSKPQILWFYTLIPKGTSRNGEHRRQAKNCVCIGATNMYCQKTALLVFHSPWCLKQKTQIVPSSFTLLVDQGIAWSLKHDTLNLRFVGSSPSLAKDFCIAGACVTQVVPSSSMILLWDSYSNKLSKCQVCCPLKLTHPQFVPHAP